MHIPLRTMEDFVTWTATSKIRRHLMEYNNEVCVLPLTVFH